MTTNMVHWASLYTAPPFSSDMMPHWTGTPASDIWWPSLENCSNLFTSGRTPTGADIWSLLKHIRSAQASSTHPPGMLSCSFNVSCKIPNKSEPGELLKITQTDNIGSEDEQAKQ